MVRAIINGKVFTPDRVLSPGIVLIEGERISALEVAGTLTVPSEAEVIDAQGQAVVPGFIDVHIHGLMGHDAMGGELAQVIRNLPAFGVTGFLATTLTTSRERTLSGLEAMAAVLGNPPPGARCLGIHLEGPFLSPTKPGMMTSDWFEPLTWERFVELQQAASGHIRMVTFAPEVGDAMACIPRLVGAGIIPSIGHSDATFDQVAQAVGLGLSHATHTFNAMQPLHHRVPGVVGAVLHFDNIVAELIADGVHIHPAVMEILLRAKGLERVMLVSDASPLAGLPDGEYTWGETIITVRDGSCRIAAGTLAGAHVLLDSGVRNLVKLVGLPLEKALVPATSVPAETLGLCKGRLAPDYDADIVLLDDKLRPTLTLVGGEIVFARDP